MEKKCTMDERKLEVRMETSRKRRAVMNVNAKQHQIRKSSERLPQKHSAKNKSTIVKVVPNTMHDQKGITVGTEMHNGGAEVG